MSIFKLHKADAQRILEANPDLKKSLVKKQLEIIIELCEAGLKLEAQRDWLAKKCEELSDDPEDFFMPYNTPAKEWIERAEQAAKEAKC